MNLKLIYENMPAGNTRYKKLPEHGLFKGCIPDQLL